MSALDTLNQNILGLVALLVSLVALLTTVLQVLQQYFSSAEGYRRCAHSVMGLWAKGTHRRLRMYEFRIEVVFETPVIFLAAPNNTKGPIRNRKIYYIDGTSKSYEETKVLGQDKQNEQDKQATTSVHTADDEQASWVTLLSTLQREEKESRAWDKTQRNKPAPPSRTFQTLQTPASPQYQLSVGIQRKTRSWDFMPTQITRPYATSAMCHLVEMVAMMGMYWKVFDQTLWNLRAEGNGFILTSSQIQGLGVMVVFTATAKSVFEQYRVIPSEQVKELSFGTVPNIFDDEAYLARELNAQSLGLHFGSEKDVNTTLEALGCTAQTLDRYKNDHKHMFSLSFEIIGMLGQVFRLRGSSFRMIPNPTGDPWLKKIGSRASWRITRLMDIFQAKLDELVAIKEIPSSPEVQAILRQWKNISDLKGLDDNKILNIHAREAVHDALDRTTDYLLSIIQAELLGVLVSHITSVVDILSDPDSSLNTIILAHKEEALLNYYFDKIRPTVIGKKNAKGDEPTDAEKDKRTIIWVSLIFRMLCWFLLHDFHKEDVMIVPADLKGSRMPVYIG